MFAGARGTGCGSTPLRQRWLWTSGGFLDSKSNPGAGCLDGWVLQVPKRLTVVCWKHDGPAQKGSEHIFCSETAQVLWCEQLTFCTCSTRPLLSTTPCLLGSWDQGWGGQQNQQTDQHFTLVFHTCTQTSAHISKVSTNIITKITVNYHE